MVSFQHLCAHQNVNAHIRLAGMISQGNFSRIFNPRHVTLNRLDELQDLWFVPSQHLSVGYSYTGMSISDFAELHVPAGTQDDGERRPTLSVEQARCSSELSRWSSFRALEDPGLSPYVHLGIRMCGVRLCRLENVQVVQYYKYKLRTVHWN